MSNILLFAGTTEGRLLLEALSSTDNNVCACTATEYGREIIINEVPNNCKVLSGRLDLEHMKNLMTQEQFDVVIDATHPYAEVVSQNIVLACKSIGIKYLRLLRNESNLCKKDYKNVISVNDTLEAVKYLNSMSGNILLTVGSKELKKYTKVKDYKNRIYARVLPMEDVVHLSNELGFSGKNLLCMQGPFSYEMNVAMIKWLNCEFLVTKDSGKPGGTDDKIKAALDLGIKVVVIKRPNNETGLSFQQVLLELGVNSVNIKKDACKEKKKNNTSKTWFPYFMSSQNRKVLVIGAGKIAERRLKTLLMFSFNITVVAPFISNNILSMKTEKLNIVSRKYSEKDLEDKDIVFAITNDREINHRIYSDCKKRKILVNVCDCKEECDFYFPGVVIKDNVVVGVTAEGSNHKKAKEVTNMIENLL